LPVRLALQVQLFAAQAQLFAALEMFFQELPVVLLVCSQRRE
jgi:hypothetical protein